MPFDAKVFKILIASPGDVAEERDIVAEVVDQWNNLNADSSKVVLLPVRWETHSAPILGDRPQGVINDQIVKGCDLLIGVFWTRIGSPTGASESGTVEEIEWFIKNNKPVMLYFSSRPVDPTKLDIDQYAALTKFNDKMRKIGLTGSYENITDFREKLLFQISKNMSSLLSGEAIPKPTISQQKKKVQEIEKIVKKGTVYLEDYEKDGIVRSFLVKGDTRNFKDVLKEMGGRWNGTLQGWVFPKSKEIPVAEFIKKCG